MHLLVHIPPIKSIRRGVTDTCYWKIVVPLFWGRFHRLMTIGTLAKTEL